MTPSPAPVQVTKRNVLAVVATLTIACGASAAAPGAAGAASPQCGDACISVFSAELGSHGQLNFVEAVLGDGGARAGQPVGLKRADKLDPTQDIMPEAPKPDAKVSDFFAAGMVSESPDAPATTVCAEAVAAVIAVASLTLTVIESEQSYVPLSTPTDEVTLQLSNL